MLSDADILEGYQRETGKPMRVDDFRAFKRFMAACECEDADSFADADKRINATIEMYRDGAPGFEDFLDRLIALKERI